MKQEAVKPKKKSRKQKGRKGGEAEKLVQAWLEMQGWLVHRAARAGFVKFQRADGTDGAFCQSHDMFGALDLLAIQAEEIPETWALQVTTQKGLTLRRQKLAAVKWPCSWRVSLVTHEAIPNPTNRARRLYFLRFEEITPAEGWREPYSVQIDQAAIEAYRRAKNPPKPRKPKAKNVTAGSGDPAA